MAAVPLSPLPEGYYESTNPFLVHGPRGFEEFKRLESFGMYVRMDFPGVPEERVRLSLDPAKKSLAVYADAPRVHRHDSAHRKYLSVIETVCRCCVFEGFTYQMSDGVLRLHLSKNNIVDPRRCSCIGTYETFFFLFYFLIIQTFKLIFWLYLFISEFKYSAFGEGIFFLLLFHINRYFEKCVYSFCLLVCACRHLWQWHGWVVWV